MKIKKKTPADRNQRLMERQFENLKQKTSDAITVVNYSEQK